MREIFEKLIRQASVTRGMTSPNPPVAAALLSKDHKLLSIGIHQGAGHPHAEILAIQKAKDLGILDQAHILCVTLEPCNHQGRTGPCTQAILQAPVRKVIYGSTDPNPRVTGGGADFLAHAGIEIARPDPEIVCLCDALIAPFKKWSQTQIPYVTVKTAHRQDGSMIPEPGRKTFTQPKSLKLAHALRKHSDAIITGSGTVLTDHPDFTVRNVTDHSGRHRWLLILDRRKRVPNAEIVRLESLGHQVKILSGSIVDALKFLGNAGCLQVLVEAGPELSQAILKGGFWDEHVIITQGESDDRVEVKNRV